MSCEAPTEPTESLVVKRCQRECPFGLSGETKTHSPFLITTALRYLSRESAQPSQKDAYAGEAAPQMSAGMSRPTHME
jgi:hypothetical protein